MNKIGYDIIGDIHGHGDELVNLLKKLGYIKTQTGYAHSDRKVIFLGDFIDRGEHLQQHTLLLSVVMDMVNNNHALAVMGNHEFNALAFHTHHEGEPLREHTERNVSQHQAFLNEFDSEPELKQEILDFFYSLPVWIELDDLRIIHACWDQKYIDYMTTVAPTAHLTPDLLIKASTEGTEEFDSIERLLKGVEFNLPPGLVFKDAAGTERDAIRLQWWKQDAKQLKEVSLPRSFDIGESGSLPLDNILPSYPETNKPCFIGHYWLNGEPAPVAVNIACMDYSIAKNGKLVAYRWNGESVLSKSNYLHL